MKYILKDKIPIKCPDVLEWAKFMEDSNNIKVKYTNLKPVEVSTVFLGVDHSWGSSNDPIVFETMVFGGAHDNYQERYYTWGEAERGHDRIVEMVKGEGPMEEEKKPICRKLLLMKRRKQ